MPIYKIEDEAMLDRAFDHILKQGKEGSRIEAQEARSKKGGREGGRAAGDSSFAKCECCGEHAAVFIVGEAFEVCSRCFLQEKGYKGPVVTVYKKWRMGRRKAGAGQAKIEWGEE